MLLAFRPRRYSRLRELAIADRLALTRSRDLRIPRHAADALSATVADGILVACTVAAYLLRRGGGSWRAATA